MKTTISKEVLKRLWSPLKWKLLFVGALAFVLLIAPLGARGQFGLDTCCVIISAGLNTISGLLKNVVAKPLSQIQQIQQQQANFQQQVIYPITAINNARGIASQVQGQLREINQLYRLQVSSATLPTVQRLEQALLSHDPQMLDQV